MKIAIIGAGQVGAALARGWTAAGHSIVFGVRDTERPSPVNGVPAIANSDAAQLAEAVVLAVPWSAVVEAIAACGDLRGRLLIDATNPLAVKADGLELAIGFTHSGGEEVARLAEGAAVFKTMNQIGFAAMDAATGYPARPVMFVAGDDAARKPTVVRLVEDLGFEARDAGPLDRARLLEPYAMLWIEQTMLYGGPPDAAFAYMRKGRTS